ncbi:ribonuclease HII, partial [Xanthomonas oryzae pv. oryzae]
MVRSKHMKILAANAQADSSNTEARQSLLFS